MARNPSSTSHLSSVLPYLPAVIMGRSRDMDASDTKGYMHDLLKSGKYSDFSIVCEDFTFKVHRCIIESSQFFSAAINSGLKVGTQLRAVQAADNADGRRQRPTSSQSVRQADSRALL